MSGEDDYESDSDMSVDSHSVSGKTSVLLGYPDEPADESASALDTRIGGLPIWLNPSSPPSASLAKCKNCKSVMALLLQAYAALEDTLYERVIYVYACKKAGCRRRPGSVRAFRGLMRDEDKMRAVAEKQKNEEERRKSKAAEAMEKRKQQQQADLGNVLFGDGFSDAANPFGDPEASAKPSTSAGARLNEIAQVSESLERTTIGAAQRQDAPIQTPFESWPPAEDLESYKSWFLYVESEYLTNKFDEISQRVEVLADTSGGSGNDGPDEWSNLPESSSNIDKVFQNFADIVADNPEQVVRYERKGSPLFYSKTDEVGKLLINGNTGHYDSNLIPPCEVCGSVRVFELQLMPYAIQVLEQGNDIDIFNGMEWGTIIVGTCKNDCAPPTIDKMGVAYQEEWLGVQWEETK
ncbi:programmed cell death protein 2 [Lipomyces tetrasporus]|uniref:Programmed cell death protein 2 n=1 Tax=Lipomyces tetrasporus TaxID=54092 RepID=A0AAD7QLF2_9ASCO|nr:programmed cell death protein 2 [Lipomyces tetrasporus]KAJ8097125.1 programmed cell death protein 2 [Lipomyces tetrasporus]